MVAGAFDLDGLAVEEETFVGIPPDVAYAEIDALGIIRVEIVTTLLRFDGNLGSVEVGSFRRPQQRIGKTRVGCETGRAVGVDLLLRGDGFRHGLSGSIEEQPEYRTGHGLIAFVANQRAETECRRIPFDGWTNIRFPIAQVHRRCFAEPQMAIDSGAFIEPAVAEAGVHANHEIVFFSVAKEVAQVETERRVAVVVAADEISVEKDESAAESPVEFEDDAAALVFFGDVESAAVPADAGFRISSAERLVTVAVLLFVAHERQLDSPVMRQVDVAPLRVVEFLRGKPELSAFGEVALSGAKSQIARGIGSVSLEKFPAEIEEKPLAGSQGAG